jgi:chemotaxis-related protein WspB
MLYLLFQLGDDRYAIEANEIAEVLPLVEIKRIPQTPRGVAGLFDFRGHPVPVVDLGLMAFDRPSPLRRSTRIILVHYPDAAGKRRVLGLVAEKVTETWRRDEADFAPSGISTEGARYLGPVASDSRGLIQRIVVREILSAPVRDALFQEVGGL